MIRKLHQLLPVAREHLLKEGEIDNRRVRNKYTCYAADYAVYVGDMSEVECAKLRTAILNEIRHQGHDLMVALVELLLWQYKINVRLDDDIDSFMSSEAYIRARDAWLDEFQAKLEEEDR